jgi:hypothetical protein
MKQTKNDFFRYSGLFHVNEFHTEKKHEKIVFSHLLEKRKDVTISPLVDRSIFSILYWSIDRSVDRSCYKTNSMSLYINVYCAA